MTWLLLALLMAIAAAAIFVRVRYAYWNRIMRQAAESLESGNYREAEKAFRKALDVGRTQLAGRALTIAFSQAQLGRTLARMGRVEEAVGLLQPSTQTIGAKLGPANEHTAVALLDFAEVVTDRGDFPRAEFLLTNAVSCARHSGNTGITLHALQRLGDVLLRQGKLPDAEERFRECVELQEKSSPAGEESREGVTWMAVNRPEMLLCQGRWDEAARLYEASIAFWERQSRLPDNVDLARLWQKLAVARASLGEFPGAIVAYRQAEEALTNQVAFDHPRVASCLAQLASTLMVARRTSDAREAARQSLNLWQRNRLIDHPDAMTCFRIVSEQAGEDVATNWSLGLDPGAFE